MVNVTKIFETTSSERIIKYYAMSYETLLHKILPACSRVKGERVDQTFSILDLKGASYSLMTPKVYNFIKLAANVAQDNYPEILGKSLLK